MTPSLKFEGLELWVSRLQCFSTQAWSFSAIGTLFEWRNYYLAPNLKYDVYLRRIKDILF